MKAASILLPLALLAGAAPAHAAPPPAPTVPEAARPDSPRTSLQAYLDLAREGRHADAARYLDAPTDGPRLARLLKAVLDRHVWFDLDKISPASQGDAADGLPANVEEVARVPGPGGSLDPVRMVRREDGEGARWVFARTTVQRIPGWYEQLPDRWILESFPGPLLRSGPYNVRWWQWMALPVLFALAGLGGLFLGRLTRVLARIAPHTKNRWDDEVLARAGGPLALLWTLGLAYLLLPLLGLYAPAQAFLHKVLRAGFLLMVFWSLLRAFDVLGAVIRQSAWANEHPAARSLVPLGGRVGKVLVVSMAIIAILAELGFSVASLIAGLGIGGLALALAAQKTVENLFGAFALGVDQPFRQGDLVKVEESMGWVESIGLRSTRIRTYDRTVVSIPNGRLAEMRIESWAARDRMRLACTVGVVYGTTAAQVRAIVAEIEEALRAHPACWQDDLMVAFKGFSDSSLDIFVQAWFDASWDDFQKTVRHELLLAIMEIVERAGTSFAFPTRTVHMVQEATARNARNAT